MRRFETKALHGGYSPDATGARAVPVHRTAAYLFKDADHAAEVTQAVVASFQAIGLRALGSGAGRCSAGATHLVRVRSEEMCTSGSLGQVCRLKLSLAGGLCGAEGNSFVASAESREASVHPRSRASALSAAYAATLDAPGFRDAIRDAVARIVPL